MQLLRPPYCHSYFSYAFLAIKCSKFVTVMSGSNFHRNHEQHISFSEKLSVEIKKTGEDVLNQINNMDSKTTNQLLCKLINRMVADIFNIIPDIQEIVIKSNEEEKSNADLKEVVKKLTQYCNDIIQACDSDSISLKPKFLIFVKNIMLETEGLLNIVKKDDLHDFKHQLVENLKEILYTIHIIQARMKIQNYSQQELRTAVEGIQKEYFDDISEIEKCSTEVLKSVLIHIKHTCKHNYQMAYYLNKVASNYDSEFQHKILESAKLMNVANTTFLFESEKLNNTQEAIATLRNASINCWNSLLGLLEFIDNRLEHKKNSENLKDIAMYIVSYGFVVNTQIGKSVKHDGLFA